MKAKNIFISLALVCFVASCNMADESKTEKTFSTVSETVSMTSILQNDDCFDKKMESWFIKFNQLQDKGYTMEDANKEAIAAVVKEFKTCQGKPTQMASQEDDATDATDE